MQRVLRDLVKAVGLGDAIEICKRWGGRDFNVPVHCRKTDPLALTLGNECAQKLCKAFGGQRLQLPKERQALLTERNKAIYRAVVIEGQSHQAVANEYGLHRQSINQVLRLIRERRIPFAAVAECLEQ